MLQPIASFWNRIKQTIFPQLQGDLGPLKVKQLKVAMVLEALNLEEEIPKLPAVIAGAADTCKFSSKLSIS